MDDTENGSTKSKSRFGGVHVTTNSSKLLAIGALLLFVASTAVVAWQDSRLAVLWDLSYVLEHAHRIAVGQIPYRDFPFVHAPLTFLIQAGIIKLTGHVYWHTTVYCILAGGAATFLTWRIILHTVQDSVPQRRLLGLILSVPLVPLGIYSVLPHPFYDPDCTLAILVAVFLLQKIERKKSSAVRSFLAGAMLVVPLFVKQNTGLAFLLSATGAVIVLAAMAIWRKEPARRYGFLLAGTLIGLLSALLLIHFTAGLGNYWRWTIKFAAERRMPARADMLEMYQDKKLILWLLALAAGAILFWFKGRSNRALALLSILLMSAPFVWPTIYLLCNNDPSDRADQLLALWPILLIVSFMVAVISIRRRSGPALVLPFILLATIHGAFMSQQLWGSTYGIWPLFMILIAINLTGLASVPTYSTRWITTSLGALISSALLISGTFYLKSNERLNYSNLSEGDLARSTLPQLKGLRTRGDWIPDFDELVRYSQTNIPREDGLVLIPGEDLFYYTTGRRPHFPIVFFDHTTNPYSPEEIAQLCRERNIRWVIVKQELQLEADPLESRDRLMELIENDYEQVESLGNYDIYRRSDGQEKDDRNQR